MGLGWHSSTKGSVNQEAADSERFVGYFIVSKIPHHARCYIHRKHMPSTKLRQRLLVAADLTFYGITQLPLFSFVNPFLYRLVPSKRTCPIMSVHTVSKTVLSYRAAKADARTAIRAHAAEMETTPSRKISTPNKKPFSSSYWTPATPEATFHLTKTPKPKASRRKFLCVQVLG